jgi:hypothetical protein
MLLLDCFLFDLWCIASSKMLRNALGSVTAGIIAGYFSHIPHNLSTMKLLSPHVSYHQHFNTLVERATKELPIGLQQSSVERPCAILRTLFMPQGFMIRSTQIMGSFVLLNGISHLMDVRLWGSQKKNKL